MHSMTALSSHNGSPSAMSEPAPVLPVTKVPALDIVDRYVVASASHTRGHSEAFELAHRSDKELIQSYVRFVAQFTGLEEIAFVVLRNYDSTPCVKTVVHATKVASVEDSIYSWREIENPSFKKEEIQFILDLKTHASENDVQEPSNASENVSATRSKTLMTGDTNQIQSFTLHVRPGVSREQLKINVSYPEHLIPTVAVSQLTKILVLEFTDPVNQQSPTGAAISVPDLSILNFPPLMTPPSREWTEERNNGPYLLHSAFESWVSRAPNAPALDFVSSLATPNHSAQHYTLSYDALNVAATNLATSLQEALRSDMDGGLTQRVIPVYMSTSPELYISYLGILKAGCAFCPIPLDAPDSRILEILRDIGSPVILGLEKEPSLPWHLEETRPNWINVTEVSRWQNLCDQCEAVQSSQNRSTQFQPPVVGHDQTAYLLFTSGSTGKPKGVQVPHLAVTCSIESHAAAIPLPGDAPEETRWFQFASPTFDPSIMEIFVTLSSGGTLCAAPRSLTLTDLEATINETRATVMMATPSLAALLRPTRLTTLKSLWTMGEKLNRTVIDNFAHRSGSSNCDRMLVNAYGPTEGAINCTFLAPVEYSVRGSIIGEALPTCSMFVLDPNSHAPKAIPVGCAGELAIGGPQVSKGYLNRPTDTAKAFVDSPEFGRLYRTDDMARIVWDESGRQLIEFLGRMTSDQVKISGRRLELGEIESALATVNGVKEVVAVVSKRDSNRQGSEQIVACLVLAEPSNATREAVVQECQRNADAHLTSYMRPSAYLFLETLPRSSSGKIDRKSLTTILQDEDRKGDVYSSSICHEPHDMKGAWNWNGDAVHVSIQRNVLQALSDTLEEDISAIIPGTDLYSLGLDSLGAMRLLQQLRDLSVSGLSVSDILRAQTPGTLVSIISEISHSEDSESHLSIFNGHRSSGLEHRLQSFSQRNRLVCAERLQIPPAWIRNVLPTTATQSGMLASFLRSSNDTMTSTRSYIYHSVMPVESGVDIERFKNAWQTVIRSYDSFRTVFCWLDDDMAPFAQCTLDHSPFLDQDWKVFASSPDPLSEQDTIKLALRDAEKSINLDKAPWWISLITSGEKVTVVLSMFHAIFDGGSLQLLLEDVSSVYNSEPLSQRTSLEHVVKHHFLADQASTAEFWKKHLEDNSPVAFPCLTSKRPPLTPKTHAFEITSGVSYDHLKKASKRMGVTPLSVLQAAWGSIILAYSGTEDQDVVMGSVVSGRLDAESEVCIGPTFTTVPIRIPLEKVPKINEEWTNQTVARYLTGLNAETLSYLQPRLGSLVTAEGRLPYDTLLAFQDFNAGSSKSRLWSSVDHPPMTNDFAVMVEVWPGIHSNLVLRASFSDAYMEREAAEIMLRQLSNIITFILESPDDSFLFAPCTGDAEIKSALDPVAVQPAVDSEESLIHSKFEKYARSHPDELAFVFKGDLDDATSPANISWSYRELDSRAESLAGHLISIYGPLTECVIPICIEKSPALYLAILGILKAGGAWCPIDTSSPPQRRHDLIERTGTRVVLVSSIDPIKAGNFLPTGVGMIDVLPFTTGLAPVEPPMSSTMKVKSTRSSNMAYLIWTSGTTGAPKGVPITHSAGVASMNSLLKDIPTDVQGGAVRCLQFSQYTFDVSIQDIFYTWSCGGVLISAPREFMLGSFARLANVTNASHAHLTPAFAAGIPRSTCRTLKVVTMIGEKLPQPVADDWGTEMRAFNTYGPAEATIVSTVREFGNEYKDIKSANIGRPLASVSVFVTRNQRMLMKNAVGELALGGPQLSPGYLNQGDVTKAKYVWNEEAAQILYYTGDLARMLSDGSLEYINRVDDLVKLGGIRVELSEISYSLRNCHPLVENIETLVLSRPDRPNKVVVSFLSAPSAATAFDRDQNLLLGHKAVEVAQSASNQALAALPAHMIPSVYVVLQKIPRTQSAKTDRRALQSIYAELDIDSWENALDLRNGHDVLQNTEAADASLMQDIIAMISSLANISESLVTRPSRLGSLGIDSIRAIRLASRLNETGYRLSVIEVLQCTTVQDLINLAQSSLEKTEMTEGFDMVNFDRKWHSAAAMTVQGSFFISRATHIQESLLSETMGSSNMYWSNHFLSLDASVDIPRLKQAWFAVCQKNEALRTGFLPLAEIIEEASVLEEAAILQMIYEQHEPDWQHIECTASAYRPVLEERIKTIMTNHQENYFRQPPWAVTIFEVNGIWKMLFTVHHSIHDGPSLEFILDDVRAAYLSKPPGRPQLHKALSVILPSDEQSVRTRMFWKDELQRFADLDLPVWPDLTGKRMRPGNEPEHKFISKHVRLTEPVAHLQSKAAEFGVSSIASFLRVAWGFASLCYFGSPAVVFAETLSDRVLNSDMDKAIGPFISVIPVPFHPHGTVREVLTEQQRLSALSWKHRHVHAREIRRILNRPRGEPLYPGLFTFHSAGERRPAPGHTLWSDDVDEIGLNVEHPMALNVYQDQNDEIILEASSQSTIMSPEQLDIFVSQIDALVSAIMDHPDRPMAELSRCMPSGLLSRTNPSTSQAVQESVSLSPTHWFEFHAEQNPDWTAVEVAGSITEQGVEKECMSYGDLNAASNRVASYLSSKGFQNRSIAICAGRNLASYPVTLGIFKSGNAYLPIDEGLPDDRKAFLIEDGDCPLVFTESSFAATFANVPDNCQVVCFDQDAFQLSLLGMSSENREYLAGPDDSAYILYTSGSTGKPKGVMVTRANLSSFMESLSEFVCEIAPATLQLGGKGRWLAQASRAFDPHLAEMFFPWRHGMATVTGPRTLLMDDLQLTLAKWDITHASFVPSLLDQANILPHHCPKLKYLSVGGEKISQRVLDTWGAASGVGLTNAYGPTEVTIGCTFAHVNEDTTLRNIGAPLSSCVCHILVPDSSTYALRGQTGELCFTGEIVAKGYLNRPDAKGFVIGPDGEKMYRTGDIGRLMTDDTIEYLGRGDDQTKIRGQRLELGEVSEMLRSSAQIPIDVVTMIAKHPGLARNQLISFVARSDTRQRDRDAEITIVGSDVATIGKDLQDACKSKLPGYMVPEIVLPITHIPLAPMSGKANIKQLHGVFSNLPLSHILAGNAPSANRSMDSESRPLDVAEKGVVAEICKTVSIDPSLLTHQTNIFEIGVDSLSAISLSVRLRSVGYNASVALVMSNPVVEQLARLPRSSESTSGLISQSELQRKLSDLASNFDKNAPLGVDKSQLVSVRPCLPLQEGLVARSINNDGELYVNHVALRLDPTVDTNKLRSAWQTTAEESEILRTAFAPLDSEVVQMVYEPSQHQIHWVEEQEETLALLARREDISRDIIQKITMIPPVRFRLARCQETVLMISLHHSLYDGESFGMLLEDVATRYAESAPAKRGSPIAFIQHVYSQDPQASQTHWSQALSGCHPTIFNAESLPMESSQVVHRTFSKTLSDIERCSARLQTTVPSFIQTVFALVLADAVNDFDVTYGLVLSGRAVSVPGADSVLLPCITTVPGRLQTEGLGTAEEAVQFVQRATVRSLEYQHTSLRHIQRWVKSETPLFDCLFSFIKTTRPPSHSMWEELESAMPSDYPFAIEVEADQTKDQAYIHCGFTPIFGKPSRAHEFLEKMDVVLSTIVSGEPLPLEAFNFSDSESSTPRPTAKKWDDHHWSGLETTIRNLVASFCGLDATEVSKGSSFLSLGVDSVTAIQFSRRLRESGVSASSADVMRFSCVGALAHHLTQKISNAPSGTVTATDVSDTQLLQKFASSFDLLTPRDAIRAVFKCSPLQSAMITQTVGSPGNVYVHPHIVKLAESTDLSVLKKSLTSVVQANDILRTSFHSLPELDFSWVGAVHADFPTVLNEVAISSRSDLTAEIMKHLKLEEVSAFNAPPFRPVIVHRPDGRFFAIVMHHALYDGVSLPFIFEDMALAYQGLVVPDRPQFSDGVSYLLQGQREACDFWTKKLTGYQVAELPPVSPNESCSSIFLAERQVGISIAVIEQRCREMEVTVQSVALLAYAKVLSQLLGKRDVVFGQVLAGRSLPGQDTERTIGPLFNTVAQRVTLDPKLLTNREMVQRLQAFTSEAQDHQHAPLGMIQNSLRQTNGLKAASLFDTLFVFQKSADASGSVLNEQQIWTPWQTDDFAAGAEHKLNIEIDHADSAVIARASCKGEFLSQSHLDSALGSFDDAFRDIIEHPSRCVTVLPDQLGALPLNLTPSFSDTSVTNDTEAPAHEHLVRDILADIAGMPVENIRPDTSIFGIGLDSLSAIRIASVCRSKGLKAGVADILQGNTLRGICLRIEATSQQATISQGPLLHEHEKLKTEACALLNIEHDAVENILPCLGGQAYHLASWLASGRTLFEPAWPYACTQRVDAHRLKESWSWLRRRHPILRTCFAAVESSQAVQIVLKATHIDDEGTFQVIETSEDLTRAAQKQAREEALHPSSLATPPVRLRLLKAGDRDGILLLINHAAYDAWTMPMFVKELEQNYRGEAALTNPDFPSFVEFTVKSLRSMSEAEYWNAAVGDSSPTILTRSHCDGANKSEEGLQMFVGAWEKIKNLARLEKTCRAAGVGLQTIVLLAVSRVLGQMTNLSSPTFGLYQTGRSAAFSDIEQLSGPCLNVTPFTARGAFSDLAGNTLDKARSLQTALADRVPYEQSSLREILHRWGSANSDRSSLFNVWVNLLWMQQPQTPSQPGPDSAAELFEPLAIGIPTDFIPSTPLPNPDATATSVSRLDTSYLPKENVYIDIGPDARTDSIGFGVRVEGGLLDEAEVHALLSSVGVEIEHLVSSLGV